MRANLAEVARLAGVSTSTASRALSGDARVAPETRERVVSAARSLRYRPNRAATVMRTKRSRLIGLIINNIYNVTFNTIADVAQRLAAERGYQVLVCTTSGSAEREAAFLDTVLDHRMDAVIIVGSGENVDRINHLVDVGVAVVTMNREVPGSRAMAVRPDYHHNGWLATRHLLDLGHKRIAYLGGDERYTSGRDHYRGFVDALAAAGLPLWESRVARGPFEPAYGSEGVERLFAGADAPTALVLANHEAAFGAVPALAQRRLSLPDDLSLVCTEDALWLEWHHPPVSVVDTRAVEMGALAFALVMRQLGEGPDPGEREGVRMLPDGSRLVEGWLIERASTLAFAHETSATGAAR